MLNLYNYDLNAIFKDLRKKQIENGRKVVELPIKGKIHPFTENNS